MNTSTPITLPILPELLPAGSHDFGPLKIPAANGLSTIEVTCDVSRYPGEANLTVNLWVSLDGEKTWDQFVNLTFPGGIPASIHFSRPIPGDPSSTTRSMKASIVNSALLATSGGSIVLK